MMLLETGAKARFPEERSRSGGKGFRSNIFCGRGCDADNSVFPRL